MNIQMVRCLLGKMFDTVLNQSLTVVTKNGEEELREVEDSWTRSMQSRKRWEAVCRFHGPQEDIIMTSSIGGLCGICL